MQKKMIILYAHYVVTPETRGVDALRSARSDV